MTTQLSPGEISLNDIDIALYKHIGGAVDVNGDIFTSDITINGSPVRIFIGHWPFTESDGAPDRVFPSISFNISDLVPDNDRLDSCEQVEVSEDVSVTPPIRTMSEKPDPYIGLYQVHCWSRRAIDDRELLTQLLSYIDINDTLVLDAGHELYMQRGRTPVKLDESIGDQITYHKAIEIEVYFELSRAKTITYTQVTEIRTDWDLGNDPDSSEFVNTIVVN